VTPAPTPEAVAASWPTPGIEPRDPEPGDAADRASRTDDVINSTPSHDDIARAAYERYEARGGEDGHADEDWFFAEEQLRDQHGRRN